MISKFKSALHFLWHILSILLILLALAITAMGPLAHSLGEKIVIPSEVGITDDQIEVAQSNSLSLAETIESEGIVLLQNQDKTLPLDASTQTVNVFGWSSTQWLYGGSGSGQVRQGQVDFLEALSASGIDYNQELTQMYRDFQPIRPYYDTGAMKSTADTFSRLYEPSITDPNYYTPSLLKHAQTFSDTAIVVLGRVSGESLDTPKIQYKIIQNQGPLLEDDSRDYLSISTEEEALLKYVANTYQKVIVIINATNTMTLGQIETIPNIDACLIVGTTGTEASKAIVDVLYGKVNPSGRLTDTYAYSLDSAPSYTHFGIGGQGHYTNGKGYYPANGTIDGDTGLNAPYEAVSYTDYVEHIYVGYRWYETADVEGFWNGVDNPYGKGYDGIVQFPFGYGLSYTSFDWEITANHITQNITDKEDLRKASISLDVKVTNTGQIAGKDVVELYLTPPYTQGQIEKSSTLLVAFNKTKLLQAGESQTLTLTLKIEDLASYDAYDKNQNGFKGYEIEAGDYIFSLKTDAHHLKTMQGDNQVTFSLQETIRCDTNLSTGSPVHNLFTGSDAVDGISIDGKDENSPITYLSRSDFESTYPSQLGENRPMTPDLINTNLYSRQKAKADDLAYSGHLSSSSVTDQKPIVFGQDNDLSLMDEKGQLTQLALSLGRHYDDPLWDQLLDQVTQKEMKNLVLHAYVGTEPIASIDKPFLKDLDGPSQFGSYTISVLGIGFPNPTTLGQTWNTKLAYAFGQAIAGEANAYGFDGWYAPSANLHRSPMGGRNYEYYSEDPYLSGIMASGTINGSLDLGVYVYMKHFIVYEQDTNRDGLYTWLTEQSLRELYAKPFKMAIDQAKLTGLMSSYNRLGAIWAGGSRGLLTGLLRDEWGFKGSVITDFSDHHAYMNMDQAIRAGGNLWMDGTINVGHFQFDTDSHYFNQSLRQATKGTLYMWLNARTRNIDFAKKYGKAYLKPIAKPHTLPLIPLLIGFIDLLVILHTCLWIKAIIKKKRLH